MSNNSGVNWAVPHAERLRSLSPRPGVPWNKIVNMGTVANALLAFVPLALMGELYGLGPLFLFTCAAISCITLSYRLGQATEALGSRLGPVSGGLLNATFGNTAELIISVVALSHGLLLIVRLTLIGSILGQLLLVLGTSLLVAGLKHKDLSFSRPSIQVHFTLMIIALLAIGLPSVLLSAGAEKAQASASFLTPMLCALLLVIYGLAVIFVLRTQPQELEDDSGPHWSLPRRFIVLAAATGGIVMVSELLVGSITPLVEATGVSQVFIGLILIPIFGNVVDHIVAITVALKNRMDMSLTISVGFAAQVVCMVLPVIVIVSMFMGQPMGLIFTPIELMSLAAGLLLMVPVLLDGATGWKGPSFSHAT